MDSPIWRLVVAKAFFFVILLAGGVLLVALRMLLKKHMPQGVWKELLLRDEKDNRSIKQIIAAERLRKQAEKRQSQGQDRIPESGDVVVRQVDAEEPRRLSQD